MCRQEKSAQSEKLALVPAKITFIGGQCDTTHDILGEVVTVQIAKGSEMLNFKVMPKRWVVSAALQGWGLEPVAMEELRATAKHQPAASSLFILGATTQKIVKMF